MSTYCVTTPIYYVNDKPHIGHAYTTLAADVLSRFLHLDGNNVKFVTGTDEHGQKIEKSSKKANLKPQDFVDKISRKFHELSDQMNCHYDDFIRTTEGRHKSAVLALWQRLVERDQIYLGHYSGWYSVRDEAFYKEDELIKDKAPTGTEVKWVEEPSYFFRLSEWRDYLLDFYQEHCDFIYPKSRYNEVIAFLKLGLEDLSISRTSCKWGIKVPNDEAHIIYVWIDALANYITACGFPGPAYEQNWSNVIHIIGKDILRFHAIFWPAILAAAELPMPKKLVVHGWWIRNKQKISKSIGNVIDPFLLIDKYGLDALRFFLMREIHFGSDGDFDENSLVQKVNSELSNNIGNLHRRVLTLVRKKCMAIVPASCKNMQDEVLLQIATEKVEQFKSYMYKNDFREALKTVVSLASSANEYVNIKAMWNLEGKEFEKVAVVLLAVIKVIAVLLQSFIPDSARKMLQSLGCTSGEVQFNQLVVHNGVEAGTVLSECPAIFPRLKAENTD